MAKKTVHLGAVGFGSFSQFALRHFTRLPGVELRVVADADPDAAHAAEVHFGARTVSSAEELVADRNVDLVYIATPPFLHHRQAMLALQAGKHVVVEKPLALSLPEADRMLESAAERNALLACNLMQRYNPLYDAVRRVVRDHLLGEPLHAYFENYAKDEPLPPEHWFWNRELSGGIFIEHGLHFFDMLEGWLGPARVESAQRCVRPGTNIEEAVQCSLRYAGEVTAHIYHGFHQPERLDRQELRLVFERGDVTLAGWIPTAFRLKGIVDRETARRLSQAFPGAVSRTVESYGGEERICTGRHKRLEVDAMVELTGGTEQDKDERYGELLMAMLSDQVAWIRDRAHHRLVTAEDARRALATAIEADLLAREGDER